MTTQLVETSEEDSFLAVARYIGDLLNEGQERTALAETPGSRFVADCVTLLAEQQYQKLLDRFVSCFDVLFSKSAEKELECSINIICHLVPRVPPQQIPSAAQQVALSVTSKVDSASQQRLQVLAQLYNVILDKPTQYAMLLETLRYGREAGLANLLVPVIKTQAEGWVNDLGLSAQQQRTLFLSAAETLRASKKKKAATRDAFTLTLKTLETLEDDASLAEVASVKDAAAGAAMDFIRSTDLYQFDLLDSPALRQLADDPQYGVVYQLLVMMLAGDIEAFEGLSQSQPQLFETIGVSQEEVLTKMRMMALLGLGAGAAEVSFQNIQDALGVGAEEVEPLVVRAIGKKLLEARIDQLAGSVSITRCSHRSFGKDQWRELALQLAAWKENVGVVRKLIAAQNNTRAALPKGLQAPAVRA